MRYILTLIVGVVVETITTVAVLLALLWALTIWLAAGHADQRERPVLANNGGHSSVTVESSRHL